MTVLSWSIIAAALWLAPARDKTDKDYLANNAIDCFLFFVSFGMIIYWSFK